MQKIEALRIIFRVGLCQSYTLQRNFETVFEESLPVDSTAARIFYLWVAFKESYSDNVLTGPAFLTEEELGELAQRIGEDLDILRSLDEDQMRDVLNRIYAARYLHDYKIWPAIDFGAAIEKRDISVVQRLVQYSKVNLNHGCGIYEAPLPHAIRKGDRDIIKLLLAEEKRLHINKKHNGTATALLLAVRKGDDSIVELILRHALVDPNIADDRG
ncbi:hypothetical protein BJX66DRAFT_301711 [Aspergillus keveii]|uniref:Ankyrin repeat-containing protein n=1 Tax=Aspergillus keveii TaxID=714993 RepID=A0ABR4GA00_9EURO